jgi:hypothetical protein
MDEPTSALTLDEARRLFDLVGRLQARDDDHLCHTLLAKRSTSPTP